MSVHLKLGPNVFACGLEPNWGSQQVTSTIHKLAVTCEACKDTNAWRALRQLLPLVKGGPYRG